MAEIKVSVLFAQCLSRRILDRPAQAQQVRAWTQARNARQVSVDWQFQTDETRIHKTQNDYTQTLTVDYALAAKLHLTDPAALRPAVLLDRDGTIIFNAPYPADPEGVRLMDDVVPALIDLQTAGFRLVLVSNQSGVGRGWIDARQAAAVHHRTVRLLQREDVCLSNAYYCFHPPAAGCICRKPAPGLLLRAAAELRLDLRRSFMVGDRMSDVEAGRLAGCQTILFRPGPQMRIRRADPAYPAVTSPPGFTHPGVVARTWADVVRRVLSPPAPPHEHHPCP